MDSEQGDASMTADSYFTRRGARIAYQFTGSGSPLGYAHGVPLSREAVRRLGLLDVESLGSGHRLLAYDARGHGRSTGSPVVEDYRFENFTRDLLALMDTLGIDEPMDFAGSSLGSDTALRSAITAPQRFRRLALMIPPAAWDGGRRQAQQWYRDNADLIETEGAAAWRERWAQADPLPIFAGYPRIDLTPDVADELLPSVLRGVAMSDLPAHAAIATVAQPTLILAWDTDPLHPTSTAQTLHDLIPDSELHVSTSMNDVKTWTGRIVEFFAR